MLVDSRKIIVITGIIVVLLLGGIYLKNSGNSGAAQAGMGGATPVTVKKVLHYDALEYTEFSGRLEPIENAEIRSRISGEIETVHFKEGGLVEKGDLLFTIDQRPFLVEMSKAEAVLASAKAQMKLAQTNYDRAQKLIINGTISEQDYDSKENAYVIAQAAAKNAQASLDSAKLNLQYSKITAPISGRIGRAEITVGNLVDAGPGSKVLTTIVTSSPIYAAFDVDEKTYMNYIRAGLDNIKSIPVIIEPTEDTNVSYQGYVKSFDNQLNTTSGTARFRAIIENEKAQLAPGMFVKVKLGSPERKNYFLIPDKAILTDQSKKFVFVVNDESKAVYREIKPGSLIDGYRAVEGLGDGEKIVISGFQKVRPGSLLQANEEESEVQAQANNELSN